LREHEQRPADEQQERRIEREIPSDPPPVPEQEPHRVWILTHRRWLGAAAASEAMPRSLAGPPSIVFDRSIENESEDASRGAVGAMGGLGGASIAPPSEFSGTKL